MLEEKFDFGRQDMNHNIPVWAETRAATLREWYRQGQKFFRTGTGSRLVRLNDILQTIHDDTEREGFLMGWQSDQWAVENNKPFSVEGTAYAQPEDLNGSTYEDEGSSILADASQG